MFLSLRSCFHLTPKVDVERFYRRRSLLLRPNFSVGAGLLLFLTSFSHCFSAQRDFPSVGRSSPSLSVAKILELPMQFEKNTGQTDGEVKFLSRGPGYTLFLTSTQAVFLLHSGKVFSEASRDAHPQETKGPIANNAELRMTLWGANPGPKIEGIGGMAGTASYFLNGDASRWQVGVPLFGKVDYQQVYPGIDLVYYGSQRQLEYDFVVSSRGNPDQISLRFEGAEGCDLNGQGDLVLHVKGKAVRWHKPFAYQENSSGRQEVPARFILKANFEIGFELGEYDRSRPLVIDPALIYSTYLGGGGSDFLSGVAVDGSGNAYVIGDTTSLNYPMHTAYRSTPVGGNDVFVTKVNASGNGLVYSTYLGGNSNDYAGAIAVDSAGNAYLAGATESLNFPTKNAAFSGNAGYRDAFIAKLGPFGTNLLYASYLGGASDDSGNAIAVDNSGNAYLAGDTFSIGTGNGPFPTAPNNAYQGNNNGGRDAFVAKFNTTLSGSASLVYSTFLGGISDDKANAIAIDGSGNAYVTGEIDSYPQFPANKPPIPPESDFPVLNAFRPLYNNGYIDPYTAGTSDGFITKLNAAGTGLIYSSFLGGADNDAGLGVTVDAKGRAYVVGESSSIDFPTTTDAVQPIVAGAESGFPAPDVFIAIVETNGSSLSYSTFLGGQDFESGSSIFKFGIAVDLFGNAYVAGQTSSIDDFPLTTAFDATNSSAQGLAFVAKINPAVPGRAGLIYSAMFGGDTDAQGGSGADNRATAIALDNSGNFYVAGFTTSSNFITENPFDAAYNGGFSDAFVAKFGSPPDLSVAMIPSADTVIVGTNLTYTVYINNNGRSTFTGVTNVVQFSTNVTFLAVNNSAGGWRTNGNQLIFNVGILTNNARVIGSITIATPTPVVMTNIATLSSFETASQELNTDNNVSVVVSTVRGVADVRLTVSATPEPAIVTSNLTYTLTVQNKGTIWPATQIVVTDALPVELSFVSATSNNLVNCSYDPFAGIVTCNVATLTNGASVTFNIVMSALTNGIVTNVPSVTAFEYDPITANNTAAVTSTVLGISDLGLGLTGPVTAFAGSNATYTFTVTNRGPSLADGVVLTDPLPAALSFVSATISQGSYVQTNGIITFSFATLASNAVAQATITVNSLNSGTILNAASITNTTAFDPTAGNNSAQVSTFYNPAADLGISQLVSPASVVAMSNVNFLITVTNRGPSTASNVVVLSTVPTALNVLSVQPPPGGSYSISNHVVTCNLGVLNNGASATVTVLVGTFVDGTFTNVASITSSTAELSSNDNSSGGVVLVTANPKAPLLKINRVGGNVVLYWSTVIPASYLLQANSDLSGNSWTFVTNSPRQIGNQYFVTNSNSRVKNFYRLVQLPATVTNFNVSGTMNLAGGTFQLSFTNPSGLGFTVLATTNLAWPLNAWSNLGPATESPPGSGKYQFSDPQVASNGRRFYRVRSP